MDEMLSCKCDTASGDSLSRPKHGRRCKEVWLSILSFMLKSWEAFPWTRRAGGDDEDRALVCMTCRLLHVRTRFRYHARSDRCASRVTMCSRPAALIRNTVDATIASGRYSHWCISTHRFLALSHMSPLCVCKTTVSPMMSRLPTTGLDATRVKFFPGCDRVCDPVPIQWTSA